MADSIPEKPYFRIGEVSKILGVASYVIRYWESEFKSVKPIRTRSDQRLYRRKDVAELLTIKGLLYNDRFTISGAQKKLAERRSKGIGRAREEVRLSAIKQGLLDIKDILYRNNKAG